MNFLKKLFKIKDKEKTSGWHKLYYNYIHGIQLPTSKIGYYVNGKLIVTLQIKQNIKRFDWAKLDELTKYQKTWQHTDTIRISSNK
jgi:hypothetical protein